MSTFVFNDPAIDSAILHDTPISAAALGGGQKARRTMRAAANAERIHIQAAREALGAL